MIVITGATGQLGSLIVESLLERVPAQEVGVSVRDPGRTAGLAQRGVRVRRGDFSEPSRRRTLSGADGGGPAPPPRPASALVSARYQRASLSSRLLCRPQGD